jgi:hypothetical protein
MNECKISKKDLKIAFDYVVENKKVLSRTGFDNKESVSFQLVVLNVLMHLIDEIEHLKKQLESK